MNLWLPLITPTPPSISSRVRFAAAAANELLIFALLSGTSSSSDIPSSSSTGASLFRSPVGRAPWDCCFWTCVEKNVYRLFDFPFSTGFPLALGFSGLVLALFLLEAARLWLGRSDVVFRWPLLVRVDCRDLVGVGGCFNDRVGLTNGEGSSMGDELKLIVRIGAAVPFCVYSSSLPLSPFGAEGEFETTTLRLGLFVGGAIEANSI